MNVEDWAEIRRLHRAEGVPIKEVARRLGVARNTVRAALRSDEPPRYQRTPTGSSPPACAAGVATTPNPMIDKDVAITDPVSLPSFRA